MADAIDRANKNKPSGLYALGGIILGMGDNGSGECLHYPNGVPDEELEVFFDDDNRRLREKWKALGYVG
jgi:hypothetical protein